jgi:Flp pilus assembly protein TadG
LRNGAPIGFPQFNSAFGPLIGVEIMFTRLSATCRSAVGFWRDRSGQFAIMFALSAIPLFGMAGIALDYSMLRMRMSAYQSAADHAALTAAVSLRSKDWATAEAEGKNAFVASLPDYPDVRPDDVTLAYNDSAQVITAKASSSSAATLTGILGFTTLDFSVDAVVNLPSYPIEVSLAVDVTDSMREVTSTGESKIEALRRVGTQFIDNLMSNPDLDVKASIVPFATFAKVSRSFEGQPWFRMFSYGTSGTAAQCQRPDSQLIAARCTFREECTDQDGVAGCATKRKIWTCPPGVNQMQACTIGNAAWNGCVSLRAEPQRNTDSDYNVQPVWGRFDAWCPSDEIIPLTNNKNRLLRLMRNLQTQPMMYDANRNPILGTYTPMGMNWAMATLSPHPPYVEAQDNTRFQDQNGRRFIILMTDGANTAAPRSLTSLKDMNIASNTRTSTQNNQIQTTADNNTLLFCNQAKALGITVYTISFGDALNSRAVQMLKDCATSPDQHYFHASFGAELQAAFNSINEGILRVFLSQ